MRNSRMRAALPGGDGSADLVLKFSAQEIVAASDTISDGDVRTLKVTANTDSGEPLEGSDIVVFLSKGK